MQVVIDRFEGDFAVLELPDGQTVDAPLILFEGAKEGDVIDIVRNSPETEGKRSNIQKMFDNLKS